MNNVAVTQMSVPSNSHCLHRSTADAMQKARHESDNTSCVNNTVNSQTKERMNRQTDK